MLQRYNRITEKELRQTLRKNMPKAEVLLWSRLKSEQLGCKFRRQYSVGPYSVDFYCAETRQAVETDGESHFEHGAAERDNRRQQYIESMGIEFLRFTNTDIYENLEGVLQTIYDAVQRRRQKQAPETT